MTQNKTDEDWRLCLKSGTVRETSLSHLDEDNRMNDRMELRWLIES